MYITNLEFDIGINWKFGSIHLEILKKLEIWRKNGNMEIGNVEIWKTFRNLEKKLKFRKNLENYNFLEICKNFGNQENIQIFGNSEKTLKIW